MTIHGKRMKAAAGRGGNSRRRRLLFYAPRRKFMSKSEHTEGQTAPHNYDGDKTRLFEPGRPGKKKRFNCEIKVHAHTKQGIMDAVEDLLHGADIYGHWETISQDGWIMLKENPEYLTEEEYDKKLSAEMEKDRQKRRGA